MKKLLALIVALTMALTCVSAFADTLYAQITVDPEVAAELLTGFGVTEEDMAVVNPVISFINALGVAVITTDDGAQIDLDVNKASILSLACAANDEGLVVASTLCPNYLLTVSGETITQLIEAVAANMPATSEGGSFDPNAFIEVFGGYFETWLEACTSAAQIGEPVTGEYTFDEYTFDTMVPVTVDVPTLAEATRNLMDQILADPAAMSMLQGVAQGTAQSSGTEFNPDTFADDLKAGFDEWMAHFPVTTEAQVYANSDGSETFYMEAESTREGEDGLFTAYMLYVDENNIAMGYQDGDVTSGGFSIDGTDMDIYFEMEGMFFGLCIEFPENQFVMEFFFLDEEKPLITFSLTVEEGGEATLSLDAEGKTVLAVEDIMSGEAEDALQGLAMDVLLNGLGTMMGTLTEQVPELAELLSGVMAG